MADSAHSREFFKKVKPASDNLYFKVSPVKDDLPLDEIVNDIQKSNGLIKDKKVI